MRAARITFLAFFLLLGIVVQAQDRQLTVRKPGTGKSIRLIEGDYARFYVQNSFSLRGPIDELYPDHMMIQGERVMYPDIWKIRTTNHAVVSNGAKLALAGVLYTAIVLTNGLINNDEPLISTGTYWASGALITAGVVIISLGIHNYPTKKKWEIEYIDFSKLNQPIN